MKRKVVSLLFAFVLALTAVIPTFAANSLPRLVDDADLLSDSEEQELLASLDAISERQQVDVVVVTKDSLDGKTPMAYADDFYDDNGYGFGAACDGVLLLVSMEDRDWWISTTGYGITAFTDAGMDALSQKFLPYLSDGDYAEAFSVFAGQCDDYITQAKTGNPYDVGNLPKDPFNVAWNLFFAFAVGLIVAAIVTGSMKRKLKSVRYNRGAGNYVRQNSLQVIRSNDQFLYTHVDRSVPKQESTASSSGGSTTHTSSSGTTHGGSGGKF